ncbi:nuclear transport factor 2 family protein [Streptomyces cinnamoneus]|uniref:nuclear transport factor 2 family protein n=1 Tax=Streptomyces cinnamoneus TaxID=53446 RepID=UPI0033C89AD8
MTRQATWHTLKIVRLVEVDEQANTAVARSYVTVLQALPDLPLRPIAAGRYHDRFERREGQWRFVERRVRINLVGDVSRHLRRRQTQSGSPPPRLLLQAPACKS